MIPAQYGSEVSLLFLCEASAEKINAPYYFNGIV